MEVYLCGSNLQRLPLYPRQYIGEESGVVVALHLLELCVAKVEWEGGRGGFAGFDGACEEIGGQDFHFGGVKGCRRTGSEAEGSVWSRRKGRGVEELGSVVGPWEFKGMVERALGAWRFLPAIRI